MFGGGGGFDPSRRQVESNISHAALLSVGVAKLIAHKHKLKEISQSTKRPEEVSDLIPHENKLKVRSHSTLLSEGVANLIPNVKII